MTTPNDPPNSSRPTPPPPKLFNSAPSAAPLIPPPAAMPKAPVPPPQPITTIADKPAAPRELPTTSTVDTSDEGLEHLSDTMEIIHPITGQTIDLKAYKEEFEDWKRNLWIPRDILEFGLLDESLPVTDKTFAFIAESQKLVHCKTHLGALKRQMSLEEMTARESDGDAGGIAKAVALAEIEDGLDESEEELDFDLFENAVIYSRDHSEVIASSGMVGQMVAAGKAGKTTNVMALLEAAVSDFRYLGCYDFDVVDPDGMVGLLDPEIGDQWQTYKRKYFYRLTKDQRDRVKRLDIQKAEGVSLANAKTIADIKDWANAKNIQFLVLDSVQKMFPATHRMNSNDDMNPIMTNIRSLLVNTPIRLIVSVHHTGHDVAGPDDVRSKGASAFKDGYDFFLKMFKDVNTGHRYWFTDEGRQVSVVKPHRIMLLNPDGEIAKVEDKGHLVMDRNAAFGANETPDIEVSDDDRRMLIRMALDVKTKPVPSGGLFGFVAKYAEETFGITSKQLGPKSSRFQTAVDAMVASGELTLPPSSGEGKKLGCVLEPRGKELVVSVDAYRDQHQGSLANTWAQNTVQQPNIPAQRDVTAPTIQPPQPYYRPDDTTDLS